MSPTINNGEYVLENKIIYRFGDPQKRDVAIFKSTDGENSYIARVVGVTGDVISISQNEIKVNEQIVDSFDAPSPESNWEIVNMTLKDGEYFLLTDNKRAQNSPKVWYFVIRSNFMGKAWFIYWSFNNARFVK